MKTNTLIVQLINNLLKYNNTPNRVCNINCNVYVIKNCVIISSVKWLHKSNFVLNLHSYQKSSNKMVISY